MNIFQNQQSLQSLLNCINQLGANSLLLSINLFLTCAFCSNDISLRDLLFVFAGIAFDIICNQHLIK